ncbi:transglycosylase domain-containing protein [Oryzobacter sp. R7]|uniref:transglycosylase domain-containing protein n=1 Tax=Oryzobacter faecalis TaxID=3388656 RepID=UPI00398D24D7
MSTRKPRTRAEAKAQQARRAAAASGAAAAPGAGRSAARPGAGPRRGGPAGRRSARRTWGLRALWTALVLFILGVIGVGVAYAMTDVPEPNEIATAQASIVYYADGKTEMARLADADGNRESVPLSKVPDHMQKAMLAAEDQDFYQNNGISPTGIGRAIWVAVKGGAATQGGSTITQQYVKNYFLTQDRTLSRKAREILIAIKIDKQQSKDQILENYLNTIYYGRGAYGIQTASKAYFNKDVSKLTPAESAFLASVIRGPSLYDPGLGAEQLANAKERSGFILDAMVENGWLSAAEREKARAFPEVPKYKPRTQSGPVGYLTQMIKGELVDKYDIPESDLDRGGLRIVSTIEKTKQDGMVKAVKDERPDVDDVHVGMASIRPGDGAIVALYGGEDYSKRQQNAATQDKMQAGSTFKIFTLIAALQSGDVSLKTRMDGSSPQFFEEFADPNAATSNGKRGRVKNFGDESFGQIDMLRATGRSVNTVYAQLNIEAGPENSMKAAADAGVRSKLEPNMANVLGTDYVTVLDMANAYATIAAQGKRADPYIVREIRFSDPSVPAIKAEPKAQQVFDQDLMRDVITAMQEPVEGGTARYVGNNLGRPAAGKTGTSESFRSAWFDGYVPQLAAAVGLYRSDDKGGELKMENLPGGVGDITGGTFPARIWTAYMEVALKGSKIVPFPKPANINPDADPPPPPPPPTTTSAPPSTTAPPSSGPPSPKPSQSKTNGNPSPPGQPQPSETVSPIIP